MSHVDKPARRFLRAIAAWLGARGRTAADRDALARMSERELCDIGLDCLGAKFAADRAWVRTFPF